MSDQNANPSNSDTNRSVDSTSPSPHAPEIPESCDADQRAARQESRRFWIKLFLQPLLFLACGAVLLTALGLGQRMGWISAGGTSQHVHNHAAGADTTYICPMMCTPPQKEPGRCPVCAMELVPATSGGGLSDGRSIRVDPAARRVANIQTVAVESMPMTRTVRVVGQLKYDEGTRRTLSAYVDGRIEKLYADYTGVVVGKGDHLALVYSPRLYTAQVELLLAKKARDERRSESSGRVLQSGHDLYDSARQRVIELGMTEDQVADLESAGKATSRLHLCAPISGTVIEKLAVEGQYVKEGDAIFQLADLSTVWLMLELFPEDAATIRYGQKVQARVQSLPGETFEGRVAFIDPNVDPTTRTVGVRVVMPNLEGVLRVGDYATATVNVPLGGHHGKVYDTELANRWISPRHPHIVSDTAGECPICGVALVPAKELGFTDQPPSNEGVLVVPRDAVLMAGNNSVVYVETEPGRFEIRRIVLGPVCGDNVVIREGVRSGEQIATRGNFLIDSQMQLAGNPSLIDPTRAVPGMDENLTPVMVAALDKLSPQDRQLAEAQRHCPVTDMLLGAMGTPMRIDVEGQPVLICCPGCEARLRESPQSFLMKLASHSTGGVTDDKAVIERALSQLDDSDRKLAEQQHICPVAEYRLGSMGPPIKVDVNGKPVFICCESCREALAANPDRYLPNLSKPRTRPETPEVPPPGEFQIDLPPTGAMEMLTPQSDRPQTAVDNGSTRAIRSEMTKGVVR